MFDHPPQLLSQFWLITHAWLSSVEHQCVQNTKHDPIKSCWKTKAITSAAPYHHDYKDEHSGSYLIKPSVLFLLCSFVSCVHCLTRCNSSPQACLPLHCRMIQACACRLGDDTSSVMVDMSHVVLDDSRRLAGPVSPALAIVNEHALTASRSAHVHCMWIDCSISRLLNRILSTTACIWQAVLLNMQVSSVMCTVCQNI